MNRLVTVALLCALPFTSLAKESAATTASRAELAPIMALDVPRYMGRWFEIAHYPNRFQKKCSRNTTADYRLQQNGKLEVINRCEQANGEISEAVGSARQSGESSSPKIKVRFAPAWLSFLPVVWGDYWVIDLDDAYTLAAVSEPSREYLWILSRTPDVDPAMYEALLQRLKEKGFDLQTLVRSRHD